MQRQLLDGERIFTIADFLSPQQCESHVQRAEELGFETFNIDGELLPGYRNNSRVIIEAPELAESLWKTAAEHLPASIDSLTPAGFNPRFRYYRYSGNEAFAPHFDGHVQLGELTSKLTFMIYLTNVGCGGETRFYDDAVEVRFSVQPAMGKALVFEHAQLHEGVAVEDGTKYVLRTDVMYG